MLINILSILYFSNFSLQLLLFAHNSIVIYIQFPRVNLISIYYFPHCWNGSAWLSFDNSLELYCTGEISWNEGREIYSVPYTFMRQVIYHFYFNSFQIILYKVTTNMIFLSSQTSYIYENSSIPVKVNINPGSQVRV